MATFVFNVWVPQVYVIEACVLMVCAIDVSIHAFINVSTEAFPDASITASTNVYVSASLHVSPPPSSFHP